MNKIYDVINSLKQWLKKPYYFDYPTHLKLKISIGIGVLVFLLLVVFRPAGLYTLSKEHLFYQFTFGCITACNLLFFFFVITKAFPKFFNDETWTVGKHFITMFCLILFSSVIRWLYLAYIIPIPAKDVSLFKMIRVSFIIGFFILVLFIYLDEKYQFKRYSKIGDESEGKKFYAIENKNIKQEITLHSSNKKDFLTFFLKDLMYITSEKNYASFFLKNAKNNTEEFILRNSLQNIEKEFEKYKEIFRCHKSYIINVHHIKNVSGNARGYYLHLNNDKEIPVSRKFAKNELEDLIFSKA